jgi:predicted RNA polymerase sigma factor
MNKAALEAADKALALKQSSKTWALKAGLLTSVGKSEEAATAARQQRIQEIKERLPNEILPLPQRWWIGTLL